MQYKTRGIVLHSIPYKDNYSIVSVYTEEFGRASYMVPRGKSKKAAASKALFMPLAVLDMDVEHSPKRDVHKVKECRFCFPQSDVFCHPVKNILALFLAEVLYRTLRNPEPDASLFAYLYNSVVALETLEDGIANFHIVFLFNLLHYLGIYPNTDSQKEGSYFDLLNGEFTMQPPQHRHFLSQQESRVFGSLLRMSFENMSLYGFSRYERVGILNRVFEYYRLHIPDFNEIKSLPVMQSLFE